MAERVAKVRTKISQAKLDLEMASASSIRISGVIEEVAERPEADGSLARSTSVRSGFTLIELIAVIVVLAIITSLAVMSFGGTIDRYKMVQAIETLEMFDAAARREARRAEQPLTATINASRGELTIGITDRTFRLPSRVEITDFRTSRSGSRGLVRLPIASDGSSPTYAVQLTRGKIKRWFMVLGVSGQVVPIENEGDVNALLSV